MCRLPLVEGVTYSIMESIVDQQKAEPWSTCSFSKINVRDTDSSFVKHLHAPLQELASVAVWATLLGERPTARAPS